MEDTGPQEPGQGLLVNSSMANSFQKIKKGRGPVSRLSSYLGPDPSWGQHAAIEEVLQLFGPKDRRSCGVVGSRRGEEHWKCSHGV